MEAMPANCFTIMSNAAVLRELVLRADVFIGTVLVAGAKAPKRVTRDMLQEIKLGANVIRGKVTYKAVADAFGLGYMPVEKVGYNVVKYGNPLDLLNLWSFFTGAAIAAPWGLLPLTGFLNL